MSDGIGWIGEHAYEDAKSGVPGMRGSISLTAARGLEAEEFLVRLGADREQLQCQDLYKDRDELAMPSDVDMTHVSRAMYGTCGDWVYILEDGFAATWFFGYRSVPEMAPRVGEEIICLTLNRHDAPSLILHAPGDDGRTWEAEFRGSVDWSPELGVALRAAGAVFPSLYDGVSTEEEVELYYEEHAHEIPARVFAGVGHYCGLTIDRARVEAGLLPLVILPLPVI
ncbi:hypothetical protein [Streptomyces xantholiticus]|uniref:hypothetical protein n=1 Tax=Streptomyces xantholiticus TaxID=68285 RepID=UPI0016777C5C|nr:hypothetical protein [Streptomyces xantholiticus]GGW68582.1 hypothetical protein GCM10010381_61830 [Streptomyces xantholiticus]